MREYIKTLANVITADLGMKLWTWRNSRSWRKQVFTPNEMCLSVDKSNWKHILKICADSLGEIVFKLRLMLTRTLVYF